MIIEFIGIPGSGKSFISKKLHDFLEFNYHEKYKVYNSGMIMKNIKKNGKMRSILKLTPYLLRLSFFKIVFRILTSNAPFKQRKQLFMIFLIRLLMYKEIEKLETPKTLFILDEGFLHFTIAYFRQGEKSPKKQDIQYFFKRLNKIIKYNKYDVYKTFIDSNIKENYQRINNREKGWPQSIKGLTKPEQYRYLEGNLKCYKNLKEIFIGQRNMLVIDNTDYIVSLTEHFDKIVKDIECYRNVKTHD